MGQHLVLRWILASSAAMRWASASALGRPRPLEGGRGVLEERLLPAVELRRLDAQLLAQVGDGGLLDQDGAAAP